MNWSDGAEKIILCCGRGQAALDVGKPAEAMDALFSRGIEATAFIRDRERYDALQKLYPGHVRFGALEAPKSGSPKWDIVVSEPRETEPEKMGDTLKAAARLGSQIALLIGRDGETAQKSRSWWENEAIASGMRKHPRAMQAYSYTELNEETPPYLLFMESLPDGMEGKHPLETLRVERDLHMDMLREGGRRSDAHLARYFEASRYVRPGDTILDCACGLGYGSYMLFQNSPAKKVVGVDLNPASVGYATDNYGVESLVEFRAGDAQDLSFLPDNSVDFIASFETIEHLPDPEKFLSELGRVLRPSGRILISAPNEWPLDPALAQPPYHCQEYDWQRFCAEVGSGFLLDMGFIQSAGGGGRCTDSPRVWEAVAIDEPLPHDCEWILLLGMKDPLPGRDVPFVETTHTTQPDDPAYQATAYAKSYCNPWLAKGATTWPMLNAGQRLALSERILSEYPPDSADYGAALCTKAYRLLEAPLDSKSVDAMVVSIETYLGVKSSVPHVVRWQISLCYVGALLEQKRGDFAAAEAWFARCGHMDTDGFSGMSATKTTDALFQAAMFALGRGEVEKARILLETAMRTGRKVLAGSWFNIVGNETTPVLFGLHDLAQIMENLVRCGYALHQLPIWRERPAESLEMSQGLFEKKMNALRAALKGKEKTVAWLRRSYDALQRYDIEMRDELNRYFAGRLRAWEEAHQEWIARAAEYEKALAASKEAGMLRRILKKFRHLRKA